MGTRLPLSFLLSPLIVDLMLVIIQCLARERAAPTDALYSRIVLQKSLANSLGIDQRTEVLGFGSKLQPFV